MVNGGPGSAGMVSPAAVEEHGNGGVTDHPVGSRSFRFGERVFGEKIALECFEDYRPGKTTDFLLRPPIRSR